MIESNETELIEHQTVTAIVENVELAKADVQKGFELLKAAKARLAAVLGEDSSYDKILPSGHRYGDSIITDGPDDSIKLITRNSWHYILAQTGLRHYMTEKRQKELYEQIEKNELPPLTVENIMGTLQGLAGRINGLLEESVKEVFDWLRPQSEWGVGKLKTNKKFSVGEKAIVGWAVERNYGGGFRTQYRYDANFRGLGNAFSLLAGRGVLKYPDDFLTRFNEHFKTRGGDTFTDEYFEIKCYGNGNAHIKFLRLDLLAKLNKIGGGEGLPGRESEKESTAGCKS